MEARRHIRANGSKCRHILNQDSTLNWIIRGRQALQRYHCEVKRSLERLAGL